MILSPHFTLAELTRTSSCYENVPDAVAVECLKRLCLEILEPARALWGGPVRVNSGYRSLAVNKAIGGAAHSQHLSGRAADVVPPIEAERAMQLLYEAVQRGEFPQLGQAIIYASGFIHLSMDARNPRREFLRSLAEGGSGGPYVSWHPTL